MAEKKLTPQQERFCQEYILDLNGTQAAFRAGYTKNENAAAVHASRLLINPKIIEQIQKLMKARAKRTELSADKILNELMRIAFSDLSEAFNDDGKILPFKSMPRSIRRVIAAVDTEELFDGHGEDRTWTGYTKKLKLWDKMRALELLGKHLKLFTDKVEHSGKLTLEELVAGKNDDSSPS